MAPMGAMQIRGLTLQKPQTESPDGIQSVAFCKDKIVVIVVMSRGGIVLESNY